MSLIFDDIGFRPFDIAKEYEDLCLKVSPRQRCQDLAAHQYAIVPASWIKADVSLNKLLRIDHFADGKLVAVKEFQAEDISLIEFKKQLLVMELNWLSHFLSTINNHLKNRDSQGESILKLTHIKQIIAEVVTDYEMAKMLLNDESGLNQASQFVLLACAKLMKLPGGRAFLKGSVLEMLWTFEAINNVYFHN